MSNTKFEKEADTRFHAIRSSCSIAVLEREPLDDGGRERHAVPFALGDHALALRRVTDRDAKHLERRPLVLHQGGDDDE